MTHIAFDTLRFVEKLETAGMQAPVAKAILEAQREVLDAVLDGGTIATKSDVVRLDGSVIRIDKSIVRLEGKIEHVETEVKSVKWMAGFLVAGMVAMMTGLVSIIVKVVF